jgi:hypothetical protein
MDTSYESENKHSIKLLHQDDLTHKIDPLQVISNFEDEVRYNIEYRINDMRPPVMLFVIWVVFVILFSIGISIAVIANFLSMIFDTILILAYPNIILQVVAVVFGMIGVWFSIASFIVTYRVIKYRYHPSTAGLK